MKKKMKVFMSLLVMFMVIVCSNTLQVHAGEEAQAVAAEDSTIGEDGLISLRNTNIKYTTISLSFSGGKAYCSASVTGYTSNTSSVSIYMTLYKYSGGSWSYVNSWSGSASSYTYTLSKNTSASSGTYKLVVDYYASGEHISKSTQNTY